jgi:hypothetical protein
MPLLYRAESERFSRSALDPRLKSWACGPAFCQFDGRGRWRYRRLDQRGAHLLHEIWSVELRGGDVHRLAPRRKICLMRRVRMPDTEFAGRPRNR